MQMNPVIDDQGKIIDYEPAQRRGGWQSDLSDFQEDDEGNLTYNSGVEEHRDQSSFSFDEYLSDITEVHPNLVDAVKWAADYPYFGEEFINEWNTVINGEGDLDRLNEMIDQLLTEYNTEHGEVPEENDQSDEEWFENLPQHEIEAEVEYISNFNPNAEEAEYLSQMIGQYHSDSIHADILRAGFMIANDAYSADEAIADITRIHGEAAATRAYFELKEQLNG